MELKRVQNLLTLFIFFNFFTYMAVFILFINSQALSELLKGTSFNAFNLLLTIFNTLLFPTIELITLFFFIGSLISLFLFFFIDNWNKLFNKD